MVEPNAPRCLYYNLNCAIVASQTVLTQEESHLDDTSGKSYKYWLEMGEILLSLCEAVLTSAIRTVTFLA